MTEPLTVHTVISIEAAPEQVWKVLVDLAGYRQWHPSIELLGRSDGVDPTLAEGAVLQLRTNRGTPLEVDFEVTVTEATEGITLAWQGGDPEVFFGRHSWTLTSIEQGTRVVNQETFTGAMAEAVFAEHRHTLKAQYAAGDVALKNAVEELGRTETEPPRTR